MRLYLKTKANRFENKDALTSLFLCLIALIVALCLHPTYETNDDVLIEALLYGYHGMKGTPFLVYIDRVMGHMLYMLISVFPYVNWYFAMHYTTCLLSFFILSRTIIDKFKFKGVFASILIVAAGMETLYTVQYTKTAALAAIAGMIGLLYSAKEEHKWFYKVTSIILILLSCMIRLQAFAMLCPFWAFLGLFELIGLLKDKKETLKRYVVLLCIAVCLVLTVIVADKIIDNNTRGASEFLRYNAARTTITDYPIVVGGSDKDNADLLMVRLWMNNDPEVLTPDRLEELSSKYSRANNVRLFTAEALKTFLIDYIPNNFTREPLLILVFAESGLFLLFSKKRFYVIPLLGIYVILEWYLFSTGRAGFHRVDFGMLFALVASLIYLSEVSLPNVKRSIKEIIRYGVIPIVTLICVAIVSPFPILWHSSDIYCKRSVTDSFKKATGNPDYQYMVHTLTIGVDTERNIFDIPSDAYPGRFFYMGGWQEGTTFPGTEASKVCDNEESPWAACVDSDTIRLVIPKANGENIVKTITVYIEKNYGIKSDGILEYMDENTCVYRIVSVNH